MNIKINKNHFDYLCTLERKSKVIGSVLYNTFNEKSDTDFLVIYIPTIEELTNPYLKHHQFQYKWSDEFSAVDFNFTTIQNFYKNLMSGDSTINFEYICEYSNDFVYGNYKDYITTNLIRSYLGLMRRDIKSFEKSNDNYIKIKKLKHICRADYIVEDMLNNDDLNISSIVSKNRTKTIDLNYIQYYKYNELITYGKTGSFIKTMKQRCSDFRSIVNEFERKKTMPKFFDIETAKQIAKKCASFDYKKSTNIKIQDELIALKLSAIENGIKYN